MVFDGQHMLRLVSRVREIEIDISIASTEVTAVLEKMDSIADKYK